MKIPVILLAIIYDIGTFQKRRLELCFHKMKARKDNVWCVFWVNLKASSYRSGFVIINNLFHYLIFLLLLSFSVIFFTFVNHAVDSYL